MNPVETSSLYREIHEQPQVLARLLEAEWSTAEALAAEIRRRGIGLVVIAARGSSDNAARYANYLLGAANGLVVSLATPSLFTVYGQPPRLPVQADPIPCAPGAGRPGGNTLVLGISQSGQSPDIVAVVADGRRQGALTAAITNSPDSDLGRAAEVVLRLHAGVERSVAATKTYTAQLAAIALLSTCLDPQPRRVEQIRQVPDQVAAALAVDNHIPQVAERYRYMSSCVVIGRGYNYATAFELALKLKELTYTLVEPYSSADFLHGPLALVEHGFPVMVIAPSGMVLPEIRTLVGTLRDREAEVVVTSDDEALLAAARIPLRLPPGVPEWLSPLTSIVPGQLFAMHLAHARDYDPDHPRGLRKVTETR